MTNRLKSTVPEIVAEVEEALCETLTNFVRQHKGSAESIGGVFLGISAALIGSVGMFLNNPPTAEDREAAEDFARDIADAVDRLQKRWES